MEISGASMIANTLRKIRRHGILGSANLLYERLRRKSAYDIWRCRNGQEYTNPTDAELLKIERALKDSGVPVQDYDPSPAGFTDFKAAEYFPSDYHGGIQSGVWDEKLLEHWIAAEVLDLFKYGKDDIYVDVAACGSPWAQVLRARHGIQSFAIDLEVPYSFSTLDFYIKENATRTHFADASVRGLSLQCAFEMFLDSDDIELVPEIKRILIPGGKAIILPLYMHTHYCAYSTPEFFAKGYSDIGAVEYVQLGAWGVPSSRKYDAVSLKERLLDIIEREGLEYTILVLRNKAEFGSEIHCHFILEITKPGNDR
ncbi:MAG: hypothetical protein QNK24_01350 [Desulfuromusa sp.]|nr:hypothetical protein [Desulfuromusa sp.]